MWILHRIVHLKLNFTCDKCEFACISAHGLSEHMKSFHKKESVNEFRCEVPFCNFVSSQELLYKKHANRCEARRNAKRKCDDCNFQSDFQVFRQTSGGRQEGKKVFQNSDFKFNGLLEFSDVCSSLRA